MTSTSRKSPFDRLQIRFGNDQPFTPFAVCPTPRTHTMWSLWEHSWKPAAPGTYDITLEVALQTAKMRAAGMPAQRLMQSNFRDSYWTLAQLVAHHTVNGCNLVPGDLFGSGTQSGPAPGQGGSMLELSLGGKQPLQLANGETRGFLEDGDTGILRGCCERDGARRIGFGECAGTIAAARTEP
jgi:fumarylacetoacetase